MTEESVKLCIIDFQLRRLVADNALYFYELKVRHIHKTEKQIHDCKFHRKYAKTYHRNQNMGGAIYKIERKNVDVLIRKLYKEAYCTGCFLLYPHYVLTCPGRMLCQGIPSSDLFINR